MTNKIPSLQRRLRREARLQSYENAMELPLIVLAFCMIPLLLGPWIWDLPETEKRLFYFFDYLIWAIFLVDMIIRFVLTTNRVAYFKKHWLEVLVVIVPLFRPLRILRIFVFGARAWVGMRRLVKLDFLFVYGIGLVIICATVIATVETHPDSTINGIGDALWWAMATITTVGYGDEVPVTLAGKIVGFILMIGGIAFFSGVTANLAAFILKSRNKERHTVDDLMEEIRELRAEVGRLRAGPPES